MKHKTLFYLVIPLLTISAISLSIHAFIDWDGLLVNLSTELIGIVITVAYVDWVISRNREADWQEANRRIKSRLRVFINSSITGIRQALGYGFNIFNVYDLDCISSDSTDREIIRIVKEVLEPEIRARIAVLTHPQRQNLVEHLNSVIDETDKIIVMFSHNLKSTQYATLIEIRENTINIIQMSKVFSDAPNLEDRDMRLLSERMNDYLAENLKNLLQSFLQLGRSSF